MTRTAVFRGFAVVAGFAIALLMIANTSRAVWTDTTDATGIVGAGTVVLTDDDYATLPFVATNLKPGQTSTGCVAVTYSGSLAASVDLTSITVAANTSSDPRDLTPHVDLTVEHFGSADCTGASTTMTAASDTLDTYWGGSAPATASAWTPAGAPPATTQSYLVTVTVQSAAPNAAQGQDAAVTLLWTAQNT